MRRTAVGLGLIVVAYVVALATPAPAATLAARCAASKLKAAAQKLGAKARCHTAALSRGAAVDPACLALAESKFTAAFQHAEARGGCLTSGDAADVEALVDAALASLVGALPAVTTTSTSMTTSTTSTSTSTTSSTTLPPGTCGNGVREVGESCDGGNLCTSGCALTTLGPGCCQGSGACREADDFSLNFYLHNICLPDDGVPGTVCSAAGTCDVVAIDPVPLCCEAADGTCAASAIPSMTAGTSADLWHFYNYCEGITMRSSHTVPAAVCNATGHCEPS